MRIQHDRSSFNKAAEGFLARNLARRLRPYGQYVAIKYRSVIVAKYVNRDRNPDPDGIGAQTWDTFNVRTIFYCPKDLLAALKEEVERSGRSKTRVIVDALSTHLADG